MRHSIKVYQEYMDILCICIELFSPQADTLYHPYEKQRAALYLQCKVLHVYRRHSECLLQLPRQDCLF